MPDLVRSGGGEGGHTFFACAPPVRQGGSGEGGVPCKLVDRGGGRQGRPTGNRFAHVTTSALYAETDATFFSGMLLLIQTMCKDERDMQGDMQLFCCLFEKTCWSIVAS